MEITNLQDLARPRKDGAIFVHRLNDSQVQIFRNGKIGLIIGRHNARINSKYRGGGFDIYKPHRGCVW